MKSAARPARITVHSVGFNEDLYTGVGRLVIAWSAVEALLTWILGELVLGRPIRNPRDTFGLAVVNGMSGRPLLGLIKTLAQARMEPGSHSPICGILDELEDLKQKRDAVAHWQWKENKGKLVVYSLKMVGKIRVSEVPMDVEDMHKYVSRIDELREELTSILFGHGYLTKIGAVRRRTAKKKQKRIRDLNTEIDALFEPH